jgi:LacI family transcriptional regulator
VIVDNQLASFEAVKHLLSHGAKNVLCLRDSETELYTSRERIRGYEAAMKDGGLKSRVVLLNGGTKAELLSHLVLALKESPRAQAIFSTNNGTTLLVLEALRILQWKIPDDIRLIGFDDFGFASLLPSPLSVVRQPASELGKRAVRLLMDRIASSEQHIPITITLPCELIVRESCGCPGSARD